MNDTIRITYSISDLSQFICVFKFLCAANKSVAVHFSWLPFFLHIELNSRLCVNSEDELVMWCVHCACACAVQLMNNYERIFVEWRKNSFHVIHRNIVINRSDMHAERYWWFMQCHLNYVCSAKQASFTVSLIGVCGVCVCVFVRAFFPGALRYAFGYFTSNIHFLWALTWLWHYMARCSITALVEQFLYIFKLLVVK